MKRQKKSAAELRVERRIGLAKKYATRFYYLDAIKWRHYQRWADGAAFALKELRGK